jgi:hypothetical protein
MDSNSTSPNQGDHTLTGELREPVALKRGIVVSMIEYMFYVIYQNPDALFCRYPGFECFRIVSIKKNAPSYRFLYWTLANLDLKS